MSTDYKTIFAATRPKEHNSNDDELQRYSCMLTNQLDWEISDQYLSLMENSLNGNMSMP